MKRILIIISLCLIFIGAIIFTVALAIGGFNFNNIANKNSTTEIYEITDSFTSVLIDDFGYFDISIEPTNKENAQIVFASDKDVDLNFTVSREKLYLKTKDTRPFLSKFLSFNTNSALTLKLPNKEYSEFKIDTSSGDLELSEIKALKLKIEVSSGHVEMKNVFASNIEIETESGDVYVEDSDFETMSIDAESGDVEGALLTPKNFKTDTSSGMVIIPEPDTSRGICYIRTSSGDIKISIVK